MTEENTKKEIEIGQLTADGVYIGRFKDTDADKRTTILTIREDDHVG